MTDIVERAREAAKGEGFVASLDRPLFNELADEIERLRAELKELRADYDFYRGMA